MIHRVLVGALCNVREVRVVGQARVRAGAAAELAEPVDGCRDGGVVAEGVRQVEEEGVWGGEGEGAAQRRREEREETQHCDCTKRWQGAPMGRQGVKHGAPTEARTLKNSEDDFPNTQE